MMMASFKFYEFILNFLLGIYKDVRFLVSIPKRCWLFEESCEIRHTGSWVDYADDRSLYRTDRENKDFSRKRAYFVKGDLWKNE